MLIIQIYGYRDTNKYYKLIPVETGIETGWWLENTDGKGVKINDTDFYELLDRYFKQQ